MSKYMNEEFRTLERYTPGEQPQDKKYIKLNTNESPFPPSPEVIKAVTGQQVEKLCLYSDPQSKALKKAIAREFSLKEENVFVSNGSDEILNFAFMLYGKQKGTLFPDITYGFYKVFSDLYHIDYTEIPLKDDFTIDVNDYMGKNKFIVIANPNAPTGMTLDKEDIVRIIESNPESIVLIDEAYVDFGGKSCYELIKRYDNLIVCQTFSKSRSLAGARLGFCFANEEIINDLETIKYSTNPYNINRLTQLIGEKAIESGDYYTGNCCRIIENREYTEKELKESGFEVLPSKANFVFVRHPEVDGEKIYIKLKEKGILVRHFTKDRISQYNRITIGSKEQMTALVETLKIILAEENQNENS